MGAKKDGAEGSPALIRYCSAAAAVVVTAAVVVAVVAAPVIAAAAAPVPAAAAAEQDDDQDDDPQAAAAAAAPIVVPTAHVVSPHLICGAFVPRFCTILWIPPVPGDGKADTVRS